MDTPINEAFMAHAYSLILLRKDGYPCVFFGDIYGFQLPKPEDPACRGKLPDLVLARKLYSFGPQTDYFDGADCIGWVRHGTTENPDGMAVVLSWSPEVPEVSDDEDELPRMRMKVGAPGEIWTDILGWDNSAVVIDESGVGTFTTNWNRMSVFVNRDARGRERFPVNFDTKFGELC
jgi:alpha-amylase